MSFQEQGFPDDRKKLDGFRPFDTVSPEHTHSDTNSTFNIRKSLAWDNAFFTSAGVLEPEELLHTTISGATGNAVNLLGNEEEILLPSESLEPKTARKFQSWTYRKSLTWDNAFYTSPGVLDPEELSMVNKGFKKSESHQLPGTKEVWRSTESKSTIDSGSSPLASLEFELFEDTRSSMQKPASLKSKRGRGLKNVHPSKKKTEASSRVRTKASVSQRQNLDDRPESNLKEVLISSQGQLAGGSGKFIPIATNEQPKILSKANHSSKAATKRSSLGGNYVEMGTAKAALGQCSTLSKKPCLRTSSSIVTHSSTPSPKSSSSCSPASKDTSESPLTNSRRKFDYSLDDFAAGLTISSPPRFTKKNKDKLESPSQDSCEMITPKSTIYTSSATSLDGWSSESSSASMSRRSVTRQSSSQASDTIHCVGYENQERGLSNQHIKPSGLRVPSPNIGFFDEEISLVRERGSMQSQSLVPSIVSRNGGANQYGKLKPPRNVQKVLKGVNKECDKENAEPNTHSPGGKMCSNQDNSKRENTYCIKNQREGLTKQVGIIDLDCDIVMELKADKNAFHA